MTRKEGVRLFWCALLMLGADGICAQVSPMPETALAEARNDAATILPNRAAAAEPRTPRVSCQSDQLMIAAENATLGSVMAAVSACIGVEIDMPDGAAADLSYVRLGPGPTREVLDALFNSTDFNYVIQTSSQPEKVSSILLMARIKSTDDVQDRIGPPTSAEITMTPARRAWLASVRTARAGAQMQDAPPNTQEAQPAGQSAQDDVGRTTTAPEATIPGASSADTMQSTNENATAAKPSATDPQQSSTPSDSSAAAPPSDQGNELQNKIGEMQQLFEQRKKMVATPTDPSTPN